MDKIELTRASDGEDGREGKGGSGLVGGRSGLLEDENGQ